MTNKTLLALAAILEAVTGLGLLSLGLACWPLAEATLPALRAMLTYNVLVTAYLGYLQVGGELAGRLLLPAIALHAAARILLSTQ